jgi:hypothetical protein
VQPTLFIYVSPNYFYISDPTVSLEPVPEKGGDCSEIMLVNAVMLQHSRHASTVTGAKHHCGTVVVDS